MDVFVQYIKRILDMNTFKYIFSSCLSLSLNQHEEIQYVNMLWIFNLVEKNQQRNNNVGLEKCLTAFYELLCQRWLRVEVITLTMWWPQHYHSKTDMLTLQGL